jgi:hypothetical protein
MNIDKLQQNVLDRFDSPPPIQKKLTGQALIQKQQESTKWFIEAAEEFTEEMDRRKYLEGNGDPLKIKNFYNLSRNMILHSPLSRSSPSDTKTLVP